MKKFKYFSFNRGRDIEIELPDEEVSRWTAMYNVNPERMRQNGFRTVDDFIIAILAFNEKEAE